MALDPLATPADLQVYGVDDSVYSATKIAKALNVASSAVRDAAGATISSVTSTLELSALHDTFLPLPGPITNIAAVTVAGTPVTAYTFEEGGLRLNGSWSAGDISVTFTHGLVEVPEDIVDLTCQLAISWLNHVDEGGGSTAGLTSIALDDAREGYSDEAAGQISPVFIPRQTREWLAARFGGGAQVVGTR